MTSALPARWSVRVATVDESIEEVMKRSSSSSSHPSEQI